jgi:7-cyano-7-deazaguanine synthase in queuosine biosynthesis
MANEGQAVNERRMALLFSGGLDTTLEVVERLKEYDAVDLLTFDNGYCINMRGARRRVRELRDTLGYSRLRHVEIHTKDLIDVLLADKERLWDEYRSPLIFDMACKLASVTELLFYARAQGIDDLSDGAAAEQTEIFLQHRDFSVHVKAYAEDYGLNLREATQYDWSRERKQAMLEQQGFRSGFPALEKISIGSHIAHQPFCMRGVMTFFFTSPTRHLPPVKRYALPMDRAIDLWHLLLPRARAHLDHKLADLG